MFVTSGHRQDTTPRGPQDLSELVTVYRPVSGRVRLLLAGNFHRSGARRFLTFCHEPLPPMIQGRDKEI